MTLCTFFVMAVDRSGWPDLQFLDKLHIRDILMDKQQCMCAQWCAKSRLQQFYRYFSVPLHKPQMKAFIRISFRKCIHWIETSVWLFNLMNMITMFGDFQMPSIARGIFGNQDFLFFFFCCCYCCPAFSFSSFKSILHLVVILFWRELWFLDFFG